MTRDRKNVVFAVRQDMNQCMKSCEKEKDGWRRSPVEELQDEDDSRRGWRRQREQESCSYICILLI